MYLKVGGINSNIKLKINLLLAIRGSECRSLDLLAFKCVTITEYDRAKLFVIEVTVAVDVVFVEQRLELLLGVVEADFLNGAQEIREVDGAAVENVKILEHLHQASLLSQLVIRFLQQLIL